MSAIYKTVVEVKILHEYYLTDKDGNTVFELADQSDRLNFLMRYFGLEAPALEQDLAFEYPASFRSRYDDYRLKLLPAYSGFKLLTEVQSHYLPDGTLAFKPLVPLPGNLNIFVLLLKKNQQFDAYTNTRMLRSVPAINFFSNDDAAGTKTFPFLSGSVPSFEPGHQYEQGELASFGSNDVRVLLSPAGTEWAAVKGSSFANEGDARILPLKFNYIVEPAAVLTGATFVLKDAASVILHTISVNQDEPFSSVRLDFSGLELLAPGPEVPLTEAAYTLEVTGSNGYSRSFPVLFSDLMYSKDRWGVVGIKVTTSQASFSLLDEDGMLIKRKLPSGIWQEAPVFEIPVKSRSLYWRFQNNRGGELKLTPDLADFLSKDGKTLISRKARPATKSSFLFPNNTNTGSKSLPTGNRLEIRKDQQQRLCTDVKVPESALFPLMP